MPGYILKHIHWGREQQSTAVTVWQVRQAASIWSCRLDHVYDCGYADNKSNCSTPTTQLHGAFLGHQGNSRTCRIANTSAPYRKHTKRLGFDSRIRKGRDEAIPPWNGSRALYAEVLVKDLPVAGNDPIDLLVAPSSFKSEFSSPQYYQSWPLTTLSCQQHITDCAENQQAARSPSGYLYLYFRTFRSSNFSHFCC